MESETSEQREIPLEELCLFRRIETLKIRYSSTSTVYVKNTILNPNWHQVLYWSNISKFRTQLLEEKSAPDSMKFSHPEFNLPIEFEQRVPQMDELIATGAEDNCNGDDLLQQAISENSVPPIKVIWSFLNYIYGTVNYPAECNIVAIIYMNRLTYISQMALTMSNWRALWLVSVVLAQKVWSDKSIRSAAFTDPLGGVSKEQLRFLEMRALQLLDFFTTVKPSIYAKYYFELRELFNDSVGVRFGIPWQMKPLSRMQAESLQLMTTRYLSSSSSSSHKKEKTSSSSSSSGSKHHKDKKKRSSSSTSSSSSSSSSRYVSAGTVLPLPLAPSPPSKPIERRTPSFSSPTAFLQSPSASPSSSTTLETQLNSLSLSLSPSSLPPYTYDSSSSPQPLPPSPYLHGNEEEEEEGEEYEGEGDEERGDREGGRERSWSEESVEREGEGEGKGNKGGGLGLGLPKDPTEGKLSSSYPPSRILHSLPLPPPPSPHHNPSLPLPPPSPSLPLRASLTPSRSLPSSLLSSSLPPRSTPSLSNPSFLPVSTSLSSLSSTSSTASSSSSSKLRHPHSPSPLPSPSLTYEDATLTPTSRYVIS